ncbi:Membrane bound L-sorbosone dehydrogenase [Caulifigura coniformis]|uniref:Membrane bound L-sorbosone dehydrogenase n=1 Tax=Caulifigura coniformis TaxID=2527983 RepID=A0A517SDV7_9PLAN|nr:PVC-type heme-binding CxxCH protein [Caulifigura coniformis]QDT54298.1 Membrane bound L-sorbosone dehydrogenase [Caulifigura coniformis]
MRARPGIFVLLGLFFAAGPAAAQRDLKDIPSPDPELERQTFILPEGFEVNLFAGEPHLAKPVQMNFDAQGRLWVASSAIYPQVEPGKPANDRILCLEDTDGDGVADKQSVFAEGLLIPSAVLAGDGGVYVGASTDLLFYKDTDGDGRADEKRFVLSGFGTEDTHHTVHTLRFGPEQLLYFKQSIYIHSHLETPRGVKRLNAGGTWQFRPETFELNVFDRGLVNSWGVAWDDFGATFATDGAGGEGINYIVPGASYLTAYGAPRILSGLNPGSPKHCGLEIVGGPSFPADWQHSLITNDFRGHRVCRFVVSDSGSGFTSQEQQEVIKSNHVAFRPIDVKQGPDGALYIADWYNPIIQHGEVDFRDPRRDHIHGRIWRVTWKGAKEKAAAALTDAKSLGGLETPKLVAKLGSDDRFVRQSAKRILKERGPDVLPAVKTWFRGLDNTAVNYSRSRLEALWMHQALDRPDWELIENIVRSDHAPSRAAAMRVLGDWLRHATPDFSIRNAFSAQRASLRNGKVNPAELFEIGVVDVNPRVRLEAVRALAKSTDPKAIELAMEALRGDVDQYLDYALWLTARELEPIWQPALDKGEITFGGNAKQLAFVCKAAGSPAAAKHLLALVTGGKVDATDLAGVLEVIGESGSKEQLQTVLNLTSDATDPARCSTILSALINSHRRRNQTPGGAEPVLASLLKRPEPEIQARAAELAGRYAIAPLSGDLTALARGENREVAAAAIRGLEAFPGPDAAKALVELSANDKVWTLAVPALAVRDANAAAKTFVVRLTRAATAETQTEATAVLQGFLKQKNGPAALARALAGKQIDPEFAKSAVQTISSSGQSRDELLKAIKEAGRLDAQPKLSKGDVPALLAEMQSGGSAARGELLFRRDDLQCLKCHAVGDAGGVVGPNLVSLGASSQPDYILESIIDPNAKIKENFHTVVVATDDGEVLTGIKVRETDTDLILRNADDKEIAIPLAKIEGQKPGASIMPAGLIDKLTRAEVVDLAAFLAALGRDPNFTVVQTPTARRWQVLEATKEASHQFNRNGIQEAVKENAAFTWKTVYSQVNGELPTTALPDIKTLGQSTGNRGLTILRGDIEVAGTGEAKLMISSTEGVRAWLDEQPLRMSPEILLKMSPGRKRLTLVVDQNVQQGPLKVTLQNLAQQSARFAGGK